MPPVTQQSSRSGLITWLVIFAILFVTATIFATYYGIEGSRLKQELDDTQSKLIPNIIGSTSSPTISSLEAARSGDSTKFPANTPLLDVAVAQRDGLADLITGAMGSSAADATSAATAALDQAKADTTGTDVTLPSTDNLAGAVRSLALSVKTSAGQVDTLQKRIAAIEDEKKALLASTQKALAQKDTQVVQIRQEAQKAQDQVSAYTQTKNKDIEGIESDRNKERQAAQDALNAKDVELTNARNQLITAQKEIQALRTRLGGLRVDPNEPVVRQADGKIVRIGTQDIIYIDRGAGDQMVAGMTFEVYDRSTGVPPLGEGLSNENLPVGKASIEVTRVGASSSEARIIKQQPNTNVTEGDVIANLIYDPNVKFHFVVFGKFDLDQNGVATQQDTQVIKRLITQWGGQLTDGVGTDTDFVVLGQEPVIPQFTADEENDPLVQQKIATAKKELDEYEAVRRVASELNIPIMNQNRFLYFVGYFDLATR